MKIVHVEDFFHPDACYQVNLLSRLQVLEGHEVTVVTAELDKVPSFLTAFFGKERIPEKDAAYTRETGVKIVRLPLIGFYSSRAIFYPRIFSAVSRLRPDVVFVHGEDTLTGILFILLSRRLEYPLVLDCHMLEMASQNRFKEYFRWFYQRFITPIILRERIPLIRVVDSDYVQKCLGIPLSHTDLLSFGTDTAHFSPNEQARAQLRAEYGFHPDAFLVLYAGKLDETKGGLLLAEALRERLTSEHRPIEFLVVGNSDGAYGARVEDLLRRSENRIVRLPTQRYFDLARIYQAADVAVYPKQCSMSFFEAQSCGLPVLFERNEVNAQRIATDNAFTFAPGSVEDFRARLSWLASLPLQRLNEIKTNARNYVLANYDYVPIAKRFTAILARAIEAWPRRPRTA